MTHTEINEIDHYRMKSAWNHTGLLTLLIIVPFILQGVWLEIFDAAQKHAGVSWVLFFGASVWLFWLTHILIFIDDYLLFPIRLMLPFGQKINWTTLGIFGGFIIIPVGFSLFLPERQIISLTVLYLVMGLINLLIKLNRTKGLQYWLKISSVSRNEVRSIYELTEIKDIGLYVLAGWPWWIIQVETQPNNRFLVNVYEPKERQLVHLTNEAMGQSWRKRYSSIHKAVRRLGIQLRSLEQRSWFT